VWPSASGGFRPSSGYRSGGLSLDSPDPTDRLILIDLVPRTQAPFAVYTCNPLETMDLDTADLSPNANLSPFALFSPPNRAEFSRMQALGRVVINGSVICDDREAAKMLDYPCVVVCDTRVRSRASNSK